MTNKQANDKLRAEHVERILSILQNNGEDAFKIASNVVEYPVVNDNKEEEWIRVTISIPKGSRDGEKFDGYIEKDDYEFRLARK